MTDRRFRWVLAAIVAVAVTIPGVALATHLFLDVSDQSVHFDGIQFMKDSGVTTGCDDGSVFCPDDPVTRQQMATFMYRLSGNDPNTPPAVNADTVDGLDSTELGSGAFSVPIPFGEEVTLATDGVIEFYAVCLDTGAGSTRTLEVYLRSSADTTFTDDGTLTGVALSADTPFFVASELRATPTTGYFGLSGQGLAMTPDGAQLSITMTAVGFGVGEDCVATGIANYAQPFG